MARRIICCLHNADSRGGRGEPPPGRRRVRGGGGEGAHEPLSPPRGPGGGDRHRWHSPGSGDADSCRCPAGHRRGRPGPPPREGAGGGARGDRRPRTRSDGTLRRPGRHALHEARTRPHAGQSAGGPAGAVPDGGLPTGGRRPPRRGPEPPGGGSGSGGGRGGGADRRRVAGRAGGRGGMTPPSAQEIIEGLEARLRKTPKANKPLEHGLLRYQLALAYVESPLGVRRVNFVKALESLNEAQSLFSLIGQPIEYARTRNALGVVLRELGRREDAAGAFRDAAERLPDSTHRGERGGALNNLGLTLGELGRPQEAV